MCFSPNFKMLFTKAEFGQVLSGTFAYCDKSCECCDNRR